MMTVKVTSPLTATPPTTSSSTLAATPNDAAGQPASLNHQRVAVRERRPDVRLAAHQVLTESIVQLPNGREVRAFPNDWVISAGTQIVDVVSPGQFGQLYEQIGENTLKLTVDDQARLEKVLGFGSTNSSQSLTLAVQKIVSLKIGDITVNFTPSQWEQLARRAEKRGLKIAAYMDRMVEKLCSDIWTSLE
jgi:hypothetical protein